jgi:hypothetical protein
MQGNLHALKHGIWARADRAVEMITERVGVSYHQVLLEVTEHYKPYDVIERMLVQRIARSFYRLLITQAMEDYRLEMPSLYVSKSYERLLRHERIADLQLHKAIAALEKRQRERRHENQQNKLTLAPHPRSAHAQESGEFVYPEGAGGAPFEHLFGPYNPSDTFSDPGGMQRAKKRPL